MRTCGASSSRRPGPHTLGRFGRDFRRRVAGQDADVVQYAIRAQQRLHRRYWRIVQRERPTQVATVAVAREFARFVWGLMTGRTS